MEYTESNMTKRHPFIIYAPSNYSSSIEDHKMSLVSLQRPKSHENETLLLFSEVGIKLALVLTSAFIILGFAAFCMHWLPRKANKYRRLSSVPTLRDKLKYSVKTQQSLLQQEETEYPQGSSDTERCVVPILTEVTRI